MVLVDLQGDADIFFPTDFLLLEQIDHYCSGWLKLHGDKTPKTGKKRRTIIVSCAISNVFNLSKLEEKLSLEQIAAWFLLTSDINKD